MSGEYRTTGELLDLIRDFYLRKLLEAAEEETRGTAQVQLESPEMNEEGCLFRDGKLNLPKRLDVLVFEGGEIRDFFRLETKELLSFEPFSFSWNDTIPVYISPFKWEAVGVSVHGLTSAVDWSFVTAWFESWFDLNEEKETDESGLFGVVHSISDPQWHDGAVVFVVDLGSAPVEAFETLLDALRKMGATKVVISNEFSTE